MASSASGRLVTGISPLVARTTGPAVSPAVMPGELRDSEGTAASPASTSGHGV